MLIDKEVQKYINQVNDNRKKSIKHDDYGAELVDAMLQQLNLKSNTMIGSHQFDKVRANIEMMALYTQVIDLYPQEFGERSTQLKQSLQNSLYSSVEPELLRRHLGTLENNEVDSFLVIPQIFFEKKGDNLSTHAVSAIVRKKQGLFHVEIFDKAQKKIANRAEKLPNVEQEKSEKRGVTSFVYEIKDTSDHRQKIIQEFSFGLFGYLKEMTKKR